VIALGLTLPHKELENLNKRRKMMDEAAAINGQNPLLNGNTHKRRSSSKSSVKLKKEYQAHPVHN
jgi:hypothetical protein